MVIGLMIGFTIRRYLVVEPRLNRKRTILRSINLLIITLGDILLAFYTLLYLMLTMSEIYMSIWWSW